MTKKERAALAVSLLEQKYPDAICSLTYQKPHELLIATRLAAQCTDKRVNMVTPTLFGEYPTIEALNDAPLERVEELIKTCGLYKTKAKDIKGIAKMLVEDFHSAVPDNMEDLLKLPGIGRKTANLMMGDVFHKPAVVCDTHCIRITNLLGLVDTKDPYKVEIQLRQILDPEKSNDFCHRLVLFGREVCKARYPRCEECILQPCCKHYQSTHKEKTSALT